MITNNGAQLLTRQCIFGQTTGITYVDIDNTQVTRNYGAYAYAYTNCIKDNINYPISGSQVNDSQGMCLCLGLGDTPPTREDYTLAQMEVDGTDINEIITCQASSYKWAASTADNGTIIMTFQFLNEGDEPYTIKELGLFYVNKTMKILCGRIVIPPRRIVQNELVTFSYTIKLG